MLLHVATKQRSRWGDTDTPGQTGWRRKTQLTCPLDVVHTLFNEERNGTLGGHQALQGHAKVVAVPGPPGGGVQRFEGLGWFLKSEQRTAVRKEESGEAESWGKNRKK